jgi:hypothetical protein
LNDGFGLPIEYGLQLLQNASATEICTVDRPRRPHREVLKIMKIKVITNRSEADALEESVTASAAKALENLQKAATASDAIGVLWQMKFGKAGYNPLDAAEPLNLIEQLNQTFTYIASARAVKVLLMEHPSDAPFKLHLGTTKGSDIESQNGRVAAEVFAAVKPQNNNKLADDIIPNECRISVSNR